MRIKNTINNIIFSSGGMLLNTALSFLYRTVFIYVLGVEYLGLNSVFTSILMLLSLGELGVGQAIVYSLYKPLANKNNELVKALLGLYQRIYRYIGVVILVLGVIFIPLIPILIPSSIELENVNLIFLLFLLNSSLSYFYGYKRSLIYADQRAYKLVPYTAISQVMDNLIKILILLVTGDFVFALLMQLIIKVLENIVINGFIDKEYPYIKEGFLPVNSDLLTLIKGNIKAIVFHKSGEFLIKGTDSIVIASFLSISALGIYSNYTMLIGVVLGFLKLFVDSTTASLGNVIAQESNVKVEEVFKVLNFLSVCLFGWAAISFYILFQPFIELWIGSDFLIADSTVLIIVINFFMFGTRLPIAAIKSAGGVYRQDMYAPLLEGILNIGISLYLVEKYGVNGVLFGTLLASLLVSTWFRPYIVHKCIFIKSPLHYYQNLLLYCFSFALFGLLIKQLSIAIITYANSQFFLLQLLLCLIFPPILIMIFYSRSSEYRLLKYQLTPIILKLVSRKSR